MVNPGEISVPEKKEKRWVIPVFIIILVLIIAGGLVYLYYPYGPPAQGLGENQTYTAESIEKIIDESSIHLRDVLLAKKSILTSCLAISENDESLCDPLESSSRDACYGEFYWYIAVTAAANGNCDAIINSSLRRHCEGIVNGGIDDTFFQYLYTKNVSLCVKSEKELNRDNINREVPCQKLIYEYWTVKENNTDYCNKISGLYAREQCKTFLTGNCENSLNKISRDWSYFSLARDFNNVSICNMIYYNDIRVLCQNEEINYGEVFKSFGDGETFKPF